MERGSRIAAGVGALLAVAGAIALLGPLVTGPGVGPIPTPSPTSATSPVPTGTGTPSEGAVDPDPYDAYEDAVGSYIESAVEWRPPKDGFTVDETDDLGLAIGDSPGLKKALEQNLPESTSLPAGTLRVGPDAEVALIGATADVEIVPTEPIRASTGSQIGLLFIWKVHPLEPNPALSLTAMVSIPVLEQNGTTHVLHVPIRQTFPVKATFAYRAEQVATAWQTWFGTTVGAALIAGFIWLRRRQAATPARGAVTRAGTSGQSRRG